MDVKEETNFFTTTGKQIAGYPVHRIITISFPSSLVTVARNFINKLCLTNTAFIILTLAIPIKVNQSRYRPGVAQKVPGG